MEGRRNCPHYVSTEVPLIRRNYGLDEVTTELQHQDSLSRAFKYTRHP